MQSAVLLLDKVEKGRKGGEVALLMHGLREIVKTAAIKLEQVVQRSREIESDGPVTGCKRTADPKEWVSAR